MTERTQARPNVIEATVMSVRDNPDGAPALASSLAQARLAKKRRDAKMIEKVLLPDLSKEIGEDFYVTVRKTSMHELALIPDIDPRAREYVDFYITTLNKRVMQWGRDGIDFSTMEQEEQDKYNRNLGPDVMDKVMEEFGGVDYEYNRRLMATQYTLFCVINPLIVEFDEDVTDPDTQLELSAITPADRAVIQQACTRLTEEAVAEDLKSVSTDQEAEADPDGSADEDGAEQGDHADLTATPERGPGQDPVADRGDRGPGVSEGAGRDVLASDGALRGPGGGVPRNVVSPAEWHTGQAELQGGGEAAPGTGDRVPDVFAGRQS